MSGHNKWSKIKHKKAATDAQKSKIFGKLVRLIQVEAKKCGGDVNSPGLAAAIAKANKENMPKDNIERAIKKAAESGDSISVMYEAYGPGGVGLIITGLTDNTNRTSAEIKHTLSKMNGSLGSSGSVSWNFTQNEERDWIPNSTVEINDEIAAKLETLIEALEEHDDVQDVYHNAE
ncbi:YebC/PmpR family DNA-binding transcriptional regulator [Patescibacteria group bacterium]|nr:YebC/PmpR family DNA-binding transcriptional regulator [Patescibacteria group bacterium]